MIATRRDDMRNRYWELHATPNGDIERRVVIARDTRRGAAN